MRKSDAVKTQTGVPVTPEIEKRKLFSTSTLERRRDTKAIRPKESHIREVLGPDRRGNRPRNGQPLLGCDAGSNSMRKVVPLPGSEERT